MESVTLATAQEHGLTEEEFHWIQEHLGRTPNLTELGMFSAMWSEHCSYKNSRHYLKTLPSSGPRTLTQAGEENAGAIDIGDDLAVVFKVESHNHPSALEPYQGAATGVGGIMRDIFTMGARPIASLNSLRFGHPKSKKARHHLRGVVKGIGDYGNCLGVPTVAGEVFFDESYEENPLVNAMVVGVARHKDLAFAKAEGAGNPVMLIGATTGRDGIHGASFASQNLSSESEEKRSAVQVGDPFMEKLLLEATLELLQTDAILGIQDMGAAGLTCSTCEMSGKSYTGMKIHVDKVPIRETGMNTYEIMLSESQERMLAVINKGQEKEAERIVKKWGLNAVIIGEVTDNDELVVYEQGREEAIVPSRSLIVGGGAPVYQREYRRPDKLDTLNSLNPEKLSAQASAQQTLETLLQSPNLASKFPIYDQYDHKVGLYAIDPPGADAAILRLHTFQSDKGLATTIDCNARYVYLDPYQGTALAVAEASRNLSCVGAEPVGVTNCLNFANPYLPENYYYFVQAIKGMGDACRHFNLPITGGNVSFYNESQIGPVFPTPTIGMVGLIPEIGRHATLYRAEAGMEIYLAGWFEPCFGGSEYLNTIHQMIQGPIPTLNLSHEESLQTFLRQAINDRLVPVAHDLADGGLALALLELAMAKDLGLDISLEPLAHNSLALPWEHPLFWDLLLFGESTGSAVLALPPQQSEQLQARADKAEIPLMHLGQLTTQGQVLMRQKSDGAELIQSDLARLKGLWQKGLSPYFDLTQDNT